MENFDFNKIIEFVNGGKPQVVYGESKHALNDVFSKEDEKRLMFLTNKHVNESLSEAELEEFTHVVQKFYRHIHRAENSLPAPEIYFVDSNEFKGQYDRRKNEMKMSSSLVDENAVKNKVGQDALIEIVEVLGHEMTHHKQQSEAENYASMTSAEQSKVNPQTQQLISHYASQQKVSASEVAEIDEFLKPYCGENAIADIFRNKNEFYSFVREGLYLSLLYEADARKGSDEFLVQFLKFCQKSKYSSKETKTWAKQNERDSLTSDAVSAHQNYAMNISQQFENHFNVDTETLMKIVTGYEKGEVAEGAKPTRSAYSKAIMMLVKNKPLNEKRALLKVAMQTGLNQFADVLMGSIVTDSHFLEEKAQIQQELMSVLTENPVEEIGFELPSNKMYQTNIHLILNNGQVKTVVENLVKDGKVSEATAVLSRNVNGKKISLTPNQIFKYVDILETRFNPTDLVGNRKKLAENKIFYSTIAGCVSMEQKLKMLRSLRAFNSPEFRESVVFAVRTDAKYAENPMLFEEYFQGVDQERLLTATNAESPVFYDQEEHSSVEKCHASKSSKKVNREIQKVASQTEQFNQTSTKVSSKRAGKDYDTSQPQK